MPEFICNTSPLQYLHQLGHLEILPRLVRVVIVPEAVVRELEIGCRSGCDLPDAHTLPWVEIRRPISSPALPLASHLGPGESAVLALALESPDSTVILDDGLARQAAEHLDLPLIGTLGLLLNAKRAGFLPAVAPCLDRLNQLRFRVSSSTRTAVLRAAGEAGEA